MGLTVFHYEMHDPCAADGGATAAGTCAERCDGAGRVLAAAVKGIANGLHSRAGPLLKLLLQPDLLTPAHFKAQQAQHVSALTSQAMCAITAAVASIALNELLDHLRRGKGQVLWECVLSEAHARLEVFPAAGEGRRWD